MSAIVAVVMTCRVDIVVLDMDVAGRVSERRVGSPVVVESIVSGRVCPAPVVLGVVPGSVVPPRVVVAVVPARPPALVGRSVIRLAVVAEIMAR